LREQFVGADAIQLPAALAELPVPIEKYARLLGSRGVICDGLQRNAVLVNGAAGASRGAGGPGRFGKGSTRLARLDHRPPQLALLDVAQDARQGGVRQLPLDVLLPQPAAEIAYPRSGPNVAARVSVSSLDRIEQRRRQLGVRRQNGMAGRDGRHQACHVGFRASSGAQCC
jgi:hypothetical protein